MFPYWLLFFVLSAGALLYSRYQFAPNVAGSAAVRHNNFFLSVILLAILVMIGFRYEVGGDWDSYLRIYHSIQSRELDRAIATSGQEIGYTVLNWLIGRWGLGIWAVNLLCAIPFVIGLAAICRQQPNPWLALAVAAPLFIVVVGMGYTRQAAAAGFLMIGMSRLIRGGPYGWFLVWTVIGSLFHQSVLIFAPLVGLFLVRNRLGSLLLAAAVLVIGYYIVLPSIFERYSAGYIQAVYQSQGAVIRIAINGFAGAILLAFPDRFYQSLHERKIWRGWALLSIACIPAYLIVASSVIVDRLALYIIPLQIFVFSRIPWAFGRRGSPNLGWSTLLLASFAVILFVWLTYANNAEFWVPYRLDIPG